MAATQTKMHAMNQDHQGFYRAFEDHFRGTRDLIKQRLRVYLPFILPLAEKCVPVAALDLGCGRGEWLELLAEHGFVAQGVDIDDAMLSDCRHLGLAVHTADALAFLRALPSESQSLITGFHIAEHLPFDTLQELVGQALRVLRPGGLLILETPNPENITVGTASFYLDPTHEHPLPPPLLAFLTEFSGFKRHKILRLQESSNPLHDDVPVTLLQVLAGVSPDYAVVAQKEGPVDLFSGLNVAFSVDYGVELDVLASIYQKQLDAKFRHLECVLQQSQEQVVALLGSTSWRITVPLRAVKNLWMRYRGFISRQRNEHGYFRGPIINKSSDYIVEGSLSWSINYLQRRKWLKRLVLSVIRFFPGIERRLLTCRAELRRKSYAMTFGADNFFTPMAVFDSHSGLLDIGSSGRRSPEEIIINIKSELSALQGSRHE
jgi:O-antigen chain-terminating methyltransferase